MNKYKILVVDDAIENLKTIVTMFKEYHPGYLIYQTNNPKKALEIAAKEVIDLIITDWDMPSVDGIELIKRVKSKRKTKDIPVIMATGVMLTSGDLRKALEAGATDYIRKPIDAVELLARTHSALMLASYYKEMLEVKNHELTENALNLVKTNEVVEDVTKKLTTIISGIENEHSSISQGLKSIVDGLSEKSGVDSWQKFNLSFQATYKDFYKNLTEVFPELTPAELKLCALLKLGLNTKEISSILFLTPESIKVSRSRLRKKLSCLSEQSLHSFLSAY